MKTIAALTIAFFVGWAIGGVALIAWAGHQLDPRYP